MTKHTILNGDVIDCLKTLPDGSVQCVVTSPPYFGLRDYNTASWEGGDPDCDHNPQRPDGGERSDRALPLGRGGMYKDVCGKCGAVRVDKQIGLEDTPEAYVTKLVEVFREVRRVLRDDGTVWLNLGDSYAATTKQTGRNDANNEFRPGRVEAGEKTKTKITLNGLKPKDLIGIPWRVAFALQANGWYLRQDIIWCLSGGTYVYAKTQKGEMPTTIKDIARLDPSTVRLWNGEKWTQLLGISKSKRNGDEIELVLRSGERISCTPAHRFPTERGLIEAKDIVVGDTLLSCQLPEPSTVKDCAIDEDAAWFAGLYIAEGSMSGDAIQITGHKKEKKRWEKIQIIAEKYGGSAKCSIYNNTMAIRVYGKVLNAILDELVSGRTAKDKCFSPVVWRYSNQFISAMVEGYLSGDGHKDGSRWRLGLCRNYNFERDLRTACARLGYSLTLNMSGVPYNGKINPTFRGEIRKSTSNHWNNKKRSEVVEIRKARSRQFYDIGVEDEPHLFSLASGILTHNSKPNPMPESVTDRCTKAHEYIFLLTKSARYYYDAGAVKEPVAETTVMRAKSSNNATSRKDGGDAKWQGGLTPEQQNKYYKDINGSSGRNRRSVWTISTKPYEEAHFATFPRDLVEPCIKAGTAPGDTVMDIFGGSGTVAEVARDLDRSSISIELNPDYVKLIRKRLKMDQQLDTGIYEYETRVIS